MSSIKLYTDEHIYDVTDYTLDYQVQSTILSPYDSAQVALKVPYPQEHDKLPFDHHYKAAFDLDAWIVISETVNGRSRAVFWGKLTAVSYGLQVEEAEDTPALIAGDTIRLTCASWLNVMMSGQIYLSGKSLNLNGHIFDLKPWGRTLRGLLSMAVAQRNVGAVLRVLYNYLSPAYRLPKTLAGGLSLYSIPVIYNTASARRYAPDRAPLHRSVFGLAVNAAQRSIPSGTAWNFIASSFDVDPNIIELFPSLESPLEDGGTLTQALGATPCIVYRLKPFVFGPTHPPQAESETVNHPTQTARFIAADQIFKVGLSLGDGDRVNSVYVDSPLNESRGVEAFGLAGTPSLDRADIARNGLRMYRAQYPFFPVGSKTKQTTFVRELDHIISICNEIMGDSHRYVRGTIEMYQDLQLQVGHWIKLELRHPVETKYLYAYIETLSHSTRALNNGEIQRRSTLSIVRGFYA